MAFHCYITKNHKQRVHIGYLPVSLGQLFKHSLPGSSAHGLTKLQSQWPPVWFPSRAWGLPPSLSGCWRNSVFCSSRKEAPFPRWLSARGCSQLLEAPAVPSHMSLSQHTSLYLQCSQKQLSF